MALDFNEATCSPCAPASKILYSSDVPSLRHCFDENTSTVLQHTVRTCFGCRQADLYSLTFAAGCHLHDGHPSCQQHMLDTVSAMPGSAARPDRPEVGVQIACNFPLVRGRHSVPTRIANTFKPKETEDGMKTRWLSCRACQQVYYEQYLRKIHCELPG